MFGSHRISMSSRRRAQGLEYYEDVHGEKNTAEENAEGKVDECESETDSDDEDTTTTKRKNRKGFFKPWVRDNPPTTYNARCRREVLDSASKAGSFFPFPHGLLTSLVSVTTFVSLTPTPPTTSILLLIHHSHTNRATHALIIQRFRPRRLHHHHLQNRTFAKRQTFCIRHTNQGEED